MQEKELQVGSVGRVALVNQPPELFREEVQSPLDILTEQFR